jgi:hypothetical protein
MHVDLIGPFPESDGYDAVLTTVDRLTKMVVFVPTSIRQSAKGTAELFRDNVFKRFGLPKKVTSDRGKQFVTDFMDDLYKMLDIERAASTAYHPETNGQAERENAEIVKYLRQFVNSRKDDWAKWLAVGEFAINNRVADSTGQSPFYLNHGRNMRMGINPQQSRYPTATDFAKDMQSAWEEAQSALKVAAEVMKKNFDRHRRPAVNYKVGDQVLLEATNFTVAGTPDKARKLQDKRYGPFTILEKIGTSAYKLKMPHIWKDKHPVFNEKLLTPYVPPEADHQKKPPPPPPEIVDGEEEFEVEAILDSRKMGRGTQYLVHFKGYSPEEDRWTNAKDVFAKDLIADFHRRYPGKPGAPVNQPPPRPTRQQPKRQQFARSLFPADFFTPHVSDPVTEPCCG